MTPTPRIRYHLTDVQTVERPEIRKSLPKTTEPTVLEGPNVIPWVQGYAAAIGQSDKLDVVDMTAAEDTVRVQILQVGDALGWFRFMYQSSPRDRRDRPGHEEAAQ